MTEKTYIVYKHTNKVNKKVYIGITKYGDNPNQRWKNGMGYVENKKFFPDIVKFGWDNFTHEILARNLDANEAIILERKYIAKFECVEKGYNNAHSGSIPSDAGCKAISKALTGIKRDAKSIKKQMTTKADRYGSGRGEHFLGSQARKVKCNETGDIFACINEANRWSGTTKVGECCKGNRAHAGRHPVTGEQLTWTYVEDDCAVTIHCEEELSPKKTIMKIQCIETKKIYDNASDAFRDTGVATCNILRVCKGERKSAGKLHWRFIKEE